MAKQSSEEKNDELKDRDVVIQALWLAKEVLFQSITSDTDNLQRIVKLEQEYFNMRHFIISEKRDKKRINIHFSVWLNWSQSLSK